MRIHGLELYLVKNAVITREPVMTPAKLLDPATGTGTSVKSDLPKMLEKTVDVVRCGICVQV